MTGHRIQRAEKEIQSLIANYLLKGFKGSLSGLVTVTHVQVTQDMKQAKVYISVMGSEAQVEKSMGSLEDYRMDVQQHLAKSLNTKHSPKIQFYLDHSLEEGFHMTKKIEGLGISKPSVKTSDSDEE